MELSPRLLRDVDFGEQWRGYNEAEVDEFLERVATALESLIASFQETAARAEAAERRLLDRGDDDEIRRTLVLAQRTSAAAVEEARAEAERIVAEADAKVAERMADADRRLQEVEQEITRRTREELDLLEARREALKADVDALSAFVDEHRNRLAGELRRELAWLERPELSVPEPPAMAVDDLPTSTPAPDEVVAVDEIDEPEPHLELEDEPAAPEVAAAEAQLAEAGEEPEGTDDLAAARAELERALEGMPDPGPDPEGDQEPGRQIFDVLAEEQSAGEGTGQFDALAAADDDDDLDLDLHWRDDRPHPSDDTESDPFLAELRKAITDDDPLGPRDDDNPFVDEHGSEPAGSGWFRRRPRG